MQNDLGITTTGNDIVFCIADDGIGKDRDSCSRFYLTTRRKGTGLGLFFADRVIGQHGGRITVANKLCEGSVFRVRVPEHPPAMDKDPVMPEIDGK